MKYVKWQLELIKDLCDDMLERIDDRSGWKELALHSRIEEAKAIEQSGKGLVSFVKRRRM